MDPRTETIGEKYRVVERRFRDTAIDEGIKDWANAQLAEVQDLGLVVRGRAGYLDFLVTHVGREFERCRTSDLDRVPYDERRTTSLCTCNDRCALTQGRIPGAIRSREDIERAIRFFKREHAGDPLVLDHDGDPPGARQQWDEKRDRVLTVLRRVQTYLIHDRETPPERGVLTPDELREFETSTPEVGD